MVTVGVSREEASAMTHDQMKSNLIEDISRFKLNGNMLVYPGLVFLFFIFAGMVPVPSTVHVLILVPGTGTVQTSGIQCFVLPGKRVVLW